MHILLNLNQGKQIFYIFILFPDITLYTQTVFCFCFFVLTVFTRSIHWHTKKNLRYRSCILPYFQRYAIKKQTIASLKKKHKLGYFTKSVYRRTFFRIYLFCFIWQPSYFVPDQGQRVSGFIRPCTRFTQRHSIYSVVVFIDFLPTL